MVFPHLWALVVLLDLSTITQTMAPDIKDVFFSQLENGSIFSSYFLMKTFAVLNENF